MATGLAGRVAARGFPPPAYASDSAEAVAAAALAAQGGTADPAHGQVTWGHSPTTLTGFALEPPGPVQADIIGDVPGPGTALNPDQTPGYGPGTFRTHAGPVPGWAGSYGDAAALSELNLNSAAIHGVNFGAPLLQDFSPGQPDGSVILPMDPSGTEDYGASNQAPLSGAQRVLGGYDGVQGYGGGGPGPGGVNGYDFAAVKAVHQNISAEGPGGAFTNVYLDPAERPFTVPQGAGSYIPTDAVNGPGPYGSYLGADGNVYHDPSAYVPPAEPGTLVSPLTPAVAWGW